MSTSCFQVDAMMRMDDTPDFYEGAEKLLEVWFEPSSPDKTADIKWLRAISRCSLLNLFCFLYFLATLYICCELGSSTHACMTHKIPSIRYSPQKCY